MVDPLLQQLYDVREIDSLQSFLQPGRSLCVIHHPEWVDFKRRENVDAGIGSSPYRVRLITVKGHTGTGVPDELLLGICGPDDQGYYRRKLDKNLKSAFLFISWKRGRHEFKLLHNRQIVAEYDNLSDALAIYLPDGFVPEYSLESKTFPEIYDPESFQISEGLE